MESISRAAMTPGAMGWSPAVMAAMPPMAAETVPPMMMGKPVPAAMQGPVPLTGGMMMGMPPTGMMMGAPQAGMMMGVPGGVVSPAQFAVPTQQMAPVAAGMLPVFMLTLPAGGVGGSVGPMGATAEFGGPTLAAATHDARGSFKVPGWSVAVDTPLLQGALQWPAVMGAMHWPGMAAALHLPTMRFAGMHEGGHGALHWPSIQVALMPDDPAEE